MAKHRKVFFYLRWSNILVFFIKGEVLKLMLVTHQRNYMINPVIHGVYNYCDLVRNQFKQRHNRCMSHKYKHWGLMWSPSSFTLIVIAIDLPGTVRMCVILSILWLTFFKSHLYDPFSANDTSEIPNRIVIIFTCIR